MSSVLHTILFRGTLGAPDNPISLDEWRQIITRFDSFTITDTLKQKNPFASEFLFYDSPGSGYWKCATLNGPVWSEDDAIWFRFSKGTVMFIQFSDLKNPELMQLARDLGGQLAHHQIGR